MTTYTLRIPVQAWRVASDGTLPEEAREAIDRVDPRYEWSPFYRRWIWYGHRLTGHTARPGDWIVKTPYGLEAMTDFDFRACCEEVGDG